MFPSNQNAPERLARIGRRIESACRAAHRPVSSVRLLAVSKTHTVEKIRALAEAGQRAFGENYVDEALAKIEQLGEMGLEWHFIGPIQSNKTRAIAAHFDWVQSIDRAKIVRRLAEQRPAELPPLNVLIQVNLDGEAQKAGCEPEQIEELAHQIAEQPRLKLRGLMAIPAPREDPADQRQVIERLVDLFNTLTSKHPEIDTVSAGMSGDLEAAIAAGSTLVRVGTDLMGER
jgi:PLP dependent protein